MKKKYQEIINTLGKRRVEKNILLKNHTTFGIGGPANLFYEANTINELVKAVKLARKLKIPYFLLGGGANILAADTGFRGLVIKNRARQIKKLKNNHLKVASGTTNQELVVYCQKQGLTGIEFLAGIPGTLGGSLRGNAGATGKNLGDQIKQIVLLIPNNKIKNVNKKWMRYSYRSSRLKELPLNDQPIILWATLQFEKGKKTAIKHVIKENLKNRAGKIPPGWSAGCIFKNPLSAPAGLLIDKARLKGKKIGGAIISKTHANFIINEKNATAKDVLRLIKLIKKAVKKKFGVNLKEEIDFVGFN